MRAVGIPSVTCMGFVADRSASSSGHAWVAVLYPGDQWVEYESSFWMPTGGLVPETFLISQHITILAPPMSFFSPSPCDFTELHEASWTTLALPEKIQTIRVEAFHSEFICVPLVAESQSNLMLILDWTEPTPGWAVSSSLRVLNFSNCATQTFMLTLSTPSAGDLSMDMSVRLTTQSGQPVGEVTIEVGPPPTIQSVWPAPSSFVAPKPRIQANFSSARSEIDQAQTKAMLDGQDITSLCSLTEDRLTYVPSTGLAEGNHTVRVEVRDTMGNMNSKTWVFTVDSTPPAIDVVSPGSGSVISEKSPKIEARYVDAGAASTQRR